MADDRLRDMRHFTVAVYRKHQQRMHAKEETGEDFEDDMGISLLCAATYALLSLAESHADIAPGLLQAQLVDFDD